jgi:hypothetical protein
VAFLVLVALSWIAAIAVAALSGIAPGAFVIEQVF